MAGVAYFYLDFPYTHHRLGWVGNVQKRGIL